MSGAPQSSSSAAANDAQRTAPQPRPHPEKAPTRGPFWSRLPPLRTMTSTVGRSQSSQAQESGFPSTPAPPPIALPDRVSTTRILLSDTQACIQKLSARMDIIGSRSEQALKEVQLAREALAADGEKTIAEIADIVHRCQATLSKNIEVQEGMLDKINGSISKLTTSSDALLKLYEAHSASLASLTQTMHSILNAQPSSQAQHAQLIGMLAPLEPLVRSVPVRIDALVPSVERVLERSLERVLSRLPLGAYMREQGTQGPRTPRGQKRPRSPERDLAPIDGRARRRSTMGPNELLAARDPSSPLLARQRSGIWSTERLQTRGSLRRLPVEAVPGIVAFMQAEDEAPVPQGLPGSFSRRTSRRTTLPMPLVSSTNINELVNKRSRIESAVRTDAARETDTDAPHVAPGLSNDSETVQPATIGTSAPTTMSRTTHTATKARTLGEMITTSRVPFGSPPLSVNNGVTNADNTIVQTLSEQVVGSENVQPVSADKMTSGSTKPRTKTPKRKGPATKKGKTKSKKATAAAANPATGTSVHPESKKSSKVKSKPSSNITSPKRAITGNSDVSAASEHGPPNSPSTHTKSSPIPFAESNMVPSSPVPERVASLVVVEPPATTFPVHSKPRTLISLIDASQESSNLAGHGDNAAGLTAAIAHMDNDINFTRRLGVGSFGQENTALDTVDLTSVREETCNTAKMLNGARRTEKLDSEPGSTLFKGRTKRFLVIDNDSMENDILDELFAE